MMFVKRSDAAGVELEELKPSPPQAFFSAESPTACLDLKARALEDLSLPNPNRLTLRTFKYSAMSEQCVFVG